MGLLPTQAHEIESEFEGKADFLFAKPAVSSALPKWHGDVVFVMTRFVNHGHSKEARQMAERVVMHTAGTSSLIRAIDGYLKKFH